VYRAFDVINFLGTYTSFHLSLRVLHYPSRASPSCGTMDALIAG
jgi:hypothetical protein